MREPLSLRFGVFFLEEPPVDEIPIPDFRTIANQEVGEPSPDLLETIFICERRQEWYRQYALSIGTEPLSFIGQSTVDSSIEETAQEIRKTLQYTAEDRAKDSTWAEALRRLIDSAEDAGILVMVSGIVAGNTRRTLDPDEFRGFVLSDPLAPLILSMQQKPKQQRFLRLFMKSAICGWGRAQCLLLPWKSKNLGATLSRSGATR